MEQDYDISAIRASAILTTSYVAATTLTEMQLLNQLVLLVSINLGSLTSAQIKMEGSPDNTTFYQEASQQIVSGVATTSLKYYNFTASGIYRIPIATKDRYIKISAKGTGTATGSNLKITAIKGIA